MKDQSLSNDEEEEVAMREPTGSEEQGQDGFVSRRSLLGGAAVAGAVLGGGAIAGGATAAAQNNGRSRREQMVLDVACDGRTFRATPYANKPEPNDNRGTTFSVEGWIYPEGTLPEVGYIVSDEGAIGHWFCSGLNIQHGERPEPHINATATFVFGRISDSNLFPPDTLVAQGLAGTSDDTADSLRPITGGSGTYFGVIGQAGRTNLGINNTVLRGPEVPAPNFRYVFDLLYLV